ncbi:endoribonuclease Dcr-2 [Culicoides brevitarsis]|uniref:endoribonuclease Dcr-2 n=1 Tax=Culicoides brevitarsis TaxID=469753 RepID=UPI00307B1149
MDRPPALIDPKTGEEKPDEALLKERPYQQKMKDICIEKNTIIYLPTGAGKTYIAIQVINHFAKDLIPPLSEGGKRTVFVVNTIALARQQFEVLSKSTSFKVRLYTGDMNVDNWKKEQWREEFEKYQIIVATCQIIVDVITSAYLSVADINVLVIDECHSGRGDHPMHQLMSKFQNVDKKMHPRVIGLTGVLLKKDCPPEQVAEELCTLENVFMATIATVESSTAFADVMEFSTDPEESVLKYNPVMSSELITRCEKDVESLISYAEAYRIEVRSQKSKNFTRDLPNDVKGVKVLFNDFIYQLQDLGIYGGSIAILAVLVELELKKRQCESKIETNLYRFCITFAEKMRRRLVTVMDCEKFEYNKLMKFGSPKIISLVQFLDKHVQDEKTSKELKGLVFVQRRHSAKVIYHILKKIFEESFDPEKEPEPKIRADFMVGARNSLPESIEAILDEKNSRRVIERFRKDETNLIVCSSVLEEGIDLQSCNLVIRADVANTFSAYVQSKGRARMKNSKFVMMINKMEESKVLMKIDKYKRVEAKLKECLIGKTINRKMPDEAEISAELYNELIPPFVTKGGATLTALSALQLLNRYAMLMPHDRFTSTSVYWERINLPEIFAKRQTYTVRLYMPVQSTIKAPIESDEMETAKLAKRHAAFKACKQLYLNGELSDNLMPVDPTKKIIEIKDIYFKHWENFRDETSGKAGTKQMKRLHDIVFPEQLLNCTPSTRTSIAYIHIIKCSPKFDFSTANDIFERNRRVFSELLSNDCCFGIFTTKKLPELPAMRVFLSYGEIQVKISDPIIVSEALSETQLNQMRKFHIMLFKDLLKTVKSCLIPGENGANSFMIVPMKGNAIDWEVVKNFQSLSEPKMLSEPERRRLKFKPEDFLHKVVRPCHKTYGNNDYLVVSVAEHLTPFSDFPEDKFNSFAEYFFEKYSMNVMQRDQFMIDTKCLPSTLNFLSAGAGLDGSSKRSQYTTSDFYIPELVHNYKISGDYWLKALLLPSVLHRLQFMLLAEHLRVTLNAALNLPTSQSSSVPLDVDSFKNQAKEEEDMYEEESDSDSEDEPMPSGKIAPITFPKVNEAEQIKRLETPLMQLTDQLNALTLWNEEQEPIDIDRNWENLQEFELDYYISFITNDFDNHLVKQYVEKQGFLSEIHRLTAPSTVPKAILDVPTDVKFDIKLLKHKIPASPELKDVLRAITCTSSHDVFDLERFELLGDSFLKFSVSLYLVYRHPEWHEGYLSSCKGMIVSNRNLFYLANRINLPGMLKLWRFDPGQSWIPPLFQVPSSVKENMLEMRCSAHDLNKLCVSKDEFLRGELDPRNEIKFMGSIRGSGNRDTSDGSARLLLDQQYVPDKAVADSMESLLGVYLNSCGIEHTLKLLNFFEIIPDNTTLLPNLLKTRMQSVRIKAGATENEVDELLLNYKHLEKSLGYTFKDRSFLLQALLHPSYPGTRFDCYQRLEFIGDSVLDLLISAYIFEKCENMDPGQITDLRSALVNNNTLACIAVRNNFHLHILSQNVALTETITKFVDYQRLHEHRVTDQVHLLVTENDKLMGDFIDVPKVLGDVFESLIGAIFFDSGSNLEVTWKVIYKLMQQEICEFMANVPKQIIRRLYEFQPNAQPKFGNATLVDDVVKINLRFVCKNEVIDVYGFGQNKDDAKRAAAKAALQHLEKAYKKLNAC